MTEQNIQYEKTLQKGISLLTNNPNAIIDIIQVANRLSYLRGRIFEQDNQKQNVPEGVSNSDTLGDHTQTASSDNPQDDCSEASGAAKQDTGDGTFPADLISRIEVIEKGERKFVKWDCKVEQSLQDKGRTLKLLVSETQNG